MLQPRWIAPSAGIAVFLCVLLCACMSGPPMPARSGSVIEVRRSGGTIAPGETGYDDTLQLSWFGSGCHLIRLGDLSVLTDPFVTNGIQLVDARSSDDRVAATFERLHPPQAILINHTHHDHFLDARAAMKIEAWEASSVPLYGGRTSKNLLAGWKDQELLKRCHVVEDLAPVIVNRSLRDSYHLKVQAFPSKHAPHLKCGVTFFDGVEERPRDTPPSTIFDFKAGEVYNYLVTVSKGSVSFSIFYLGAIAKLCEMPGSIPAAGTRIDVVLLCAPGADRVPGYPEQHLSRLLPRHVVLSHFNTFTKEDPDEQLSTLGIDAIHIRDLSRSIQKVFAERDKDYPEFEALHIPAITLMDDFDQGRNVIRIGPTGRP